MPNTIVETKTERIYYFDYLRVIASISVIFLHTAVLIVNARRKLDVDFLSMFNVANGYDSLLRFPVDCFFLIAGVLMFAPQRQFRVGHQIRRVGIPLVSWSIVYAIANHLFFREDRAVITSSYDGEGPLLSAVYDFFTGPLAYHLWFVYFLIGIYAVAPLIRPLMALPDGRSERLLRYALTLWLVFAVLLPCVAEVWPDAKPLYFASFPSFPAGYLGLPLLGYYLHITPLRFSRKLLLFGFLLGVAATFFITYFEETQRDQSLWAYRNLAPGVVLASSCVFLLAKSTFSGKGRNYRFIALYSRLSFRIYLMYALVLHCVRSLSPLSDWYREQPIFGIPVVAAITVVVTFAIARAIDVIKPVRAYV
ncbi:MAG: acyltransferase family protein [Actinomycetota bacterium]|nr:acyltransferase family protein [Actinomycetota bacterium]